MPEIVSQKEYHRFPMLTSGNLYDPRLIPLPCPLWNLLWELRAIREGYGPIAREIDSVTVRTYNVGYMQCGASAISVNPCKASDAKFSTPYTVACALLYNNVGLEHFEPESVYSEEVRALMSRVRVLPDETLSARYPDHWGCEMTIAFKDGRVVSAGIPDASGSECNPMTDGQVIKKAVSCAALSMGRARAEVMADIILKIEKQLKLPDLSAAYGA
jgi:2-methylcitrate dehydratase PrpD